MKSELELFTFSYPEEIEVVQLPNVGLISDSRAIFKILNNGEYLEFREYEKNTWIYSAIDISLNDIPVEVDYPYYYTDHSGFFLYRSKDRQEVIQKAWDYFYPQRTPGRVAADIKDVMETLQFNFN